MLRRIALGIAYFISIVYVLLIILPLIYCYQHQWCKGPGEGDAFMPAFLFTPGAVVVLSFSLHNSIQNIRRRQPWSWIFWSLAIVFAIVLLGIIALIALAIYYIAFHRH